MPELNRLFQALTEKKDAGVEVLNAMNASPEAAGLRFPPELLNEAFMVYTQTGVYRPDPLGSESARLAIKDYLNNYENRRSNSERVDNKASFEIENICLTASTSEAYRFCFEILSEGKEGAEVLFPTPGYPLIEHLAHSAKVEVKPYSLIRTLSDNGLHFEWRPDIKALESCITENTIAIILISPHNPTGTVWTKDELIGLAALASKYELAIISDEVFSEYVFDLANDNLENNNLENDNEKETCSPAIILMEQCPLYISLNGLSKMACLPWAKCAWLALGGNYFFWREDFMTKLAVLSDAHLSISGWVQAALPSILRSKELEKLIIAKRSLILENLKALDENLKNTHITRDFMGGGYYLLLNFQDDADHLNKWAMNSTENLKNQKIKHSRGKPSQVFLSDASEAKALELLIQKNVLVYPGYFFGVEASSLNEKTLVKKNQLGESVSPAVPNGHVSSFLVLSLLQEKDVFQEILCRITN